MNTALVTRGASNTLAGFGDVTADISALVSLASAAGSSGGITAWIQSQITQLNALPVVVQNLQGIVNTLNAALTSAGLIPSNVPGFVQAQSDLTQISADFPHIQSELGVLGVTLYPALAAGTFGLNTIAALSSQGLDLVSTFDGMQQLFGYRDDARSQLATVATNPALPLSVQQSVQQALATITTPTTGKSIGTYVLLGLGLLVGYKVIRKVF